MTDKVALVTGASRGIGRAIASLLVANGRKVVACARDVAALGTLAEAHPGRVHVLPADFTRQGESPRVADEALACEGRIDELVCAAGIVHYSPVGGVTEAELALQLQVNFVAPYLLAQRVGVHMQHAGSGALLFVASTLVARPAKLTSAYAASKAALVNTTRAFALELAPSVRVNALAPGVVDTDMIRVPRVQGLLDDLAREKAVQSELAALTALHPLGRLGEVEDVARAALFLLDASWITGSLLTVDGGLSLA